MVAAASDLGACVCEDDATVSELDDLRARVRVQAEQIAALQEALTKAIQVIEWCGLNDRTPRYDYGEARPNGDKPGGGKVYNTPLEFAGWWPDRLREALALAEGCAAPADEEEK